MKSRKPIDSSFRDPSGFIYYENDVLFRQVNRYYADNFNLLEKSGLYKELTEAGLLIKHKEVKTLIDSSDSEYYKTIKPEIVPFVSYPYEWSFSMYKDAALSVLDVQKRALKKGMVLKDASAYNIQFINANPILIDTLSFEKYNEGEPWVAYQQFCKHFLAPLALMSYTDVELSKLMSNYIDGIPLELASKLLPAKTRFNPGLFLHVHAHAKYQNKHSKYKEDEIKNQQTKKVSKLSLLGIIDNLYNTIKKMRWSTPDTEWGDYYSATNYSKTALSKKEKQVKAMILSTKPSSVWDLGANTGKFSALSATEGIHTVAFDIDPVAVELNYLNCKKEGVNNLLPIRQDLTNPSSGIGFASNERQSLLERGPADTVMALALIHHLSISNNLPFYKTAEFFSQCGKHLIIEFVPKEDSQVKKLLSSRKDIFFEYDIANFKKVYSEFFSILKEEKISGTKRTLFIMKKK